MSGDNKRKLSFEFKIFYFVLFLFLVTVGFIAFMIYYPQTLPKEYDVVTYQKIKKLATLDDSYVNFSKEATLTAVGDVMVHRAQMLRAYDSESNSFDFDKAFAYMGDTLSRADYTIANLETTLAGKGKSVNPIFQGYSDFPRFNSPESLADALKNHGVDFLGTANNHSIDSKEQGIISTLDYLDKLDFSHTGTARTESEQQELTIVEVNEIKFGICAFTYATNGLPLPSDKPYLVNTLDEYKEDKIEAVCGQVRDLKQAEVDFVLVLAHWGVEYKTVPASKQKELADKLFRAGADVIFGSHPHVVQPMEVREIVNPDGSKRLGVCIYSLGNFISSQTNRSGPDKDLGLMMNVSFYKDKTQTRIDAVEVTPTCVYWSDETIGVIPVEYALSNRDKYPLIDNRAWSRMEYAQKRIISVVTNQFDLDYEKVGNWYQIQLD